MSVQAKVRCTWNREPQYNNPDSPCRILRFAPVYSDNPESENYTWSKYTPAGHMEMSVTNPAAFEQFEENKEYILTFAESIT